MPTTSEATAPGAPVMQEPRAKKRQVASKLAGDAVIISQVRLQRLHDERDDLLGQVEALAHRLDVAKAEVSRLRQRVLAVAGSASSVCRLCLEDAEKTTTSTES